MDMKTSIKRVLIIMTAIMAIFLLSSFTDGDEGQSAELSVGTVSLVSCNAGDDYIFVMVRNDRELTLDSFQLEVGEKLYEPYRVKRSISRDKNKNITGTSYYIEFIDLPKLEKSQKFSVLLKENDKATENAEFIVRKSIDDEWTDIKVSFQNKFVYTGKRIRPEVTVMDGSYKMIENQDYVISYGSNLDVGLGSWSLKGIGDYYGIWSPDYEDSSNLTIIPKGTSLKKVVSTAKKTAKITWKKQSGKMSKRRISGYQIRYGTSKRFKAGSYKTIKVKGYKNTTKSIKNLKRNKTYYFKIRTYFVYENAGIGGDDLVYYSNWSGLKKVKIK